MGRRGWERKTSFPIGGEKEDGAPRTPGHFPSPQIQHCRLCLAGKAGEGRGKEAWNLAEPQSQEGGKRVARGGLALPPGRLVTRDRRGPVTGPINKAAESLPPSVFICLALSSGTGGVSASQHQTPRGVCVCGGLTSLGLSASRSQIPSSQPLALWPLTPEDL